MGGRPGLGGLLAWSRGVERRKRKWLESAVVHGRPAGQPVSRPAMPAAADSLSRALPAAATVNRLATKLAGPPAPGPRELTGCRSGLLNGSCSGGGAAAAAQCGGGGHGRSEKPEKPRMAMVCGWRPPAKKANSYNDRQLRIWSGTKTQVGRRNVEHRPA